MVLQTLPNDPDQCSAVAVYEGCSKESMEVHKSSETWPKSEVLSLISFERWIFKRLTINGRRREREISEEDLPDADLE